MPIALTELVAPSHTAVLTMEVQRGVVGDLSTIKELAAAVETAGTIDSIARLLRAARKESIRVIHCTAEFRPDRAGSATNMPMLAAMAKAGPPTLLVGSDAAQVVPELGPEPEDLVSSRLHGIAPFTGTSLDATLRNLGVGTVVATGVSVNLGVLGLAIEAVNLGYRVVIPTDAVAGVPESYANDLLRNTLALIATRTTVDDLIAAWAQ